MHSQNQRREPRQESNQATLARVKKEMDEPRVAESAREEEPTQILANPTVLEKLLEAISPTIPVLGVGA